MSVSIGIEISLVYGYTFVLVLLPCKTVNVDEMYEIYKKTKKHCRWGCKEVSHIYLISL